MTKVNVIGFGVFEVDDSKVSELVNWLNSNKAIKINKPGTIREVNIMGDGFTGRELITE